MNILISTLYKILILIIFSAILSAKNIIPKHQLSFFPIDREMLSALTTTISGNKKFLIVMRVDKSAKVELNILRHIKNIGLNYKVLQYLQNNNSIYIKIDAISEQKAKNVINMIKNTNASIFVGKNLIPLFDDHTTMYEKYDLDSVFSDEVQEKYLIANLMNNAAGAIQSNSLSEVVIESYISNFFNRGSIVASQKIERDENGKDRCLPEYVGDFGFVVNPDDDMNENDRYENSSFYNDFLKTYKEMYKKDFRLQKALILPKSIKNNEDWLDFFHKSLLSFAYNKKELKYQKNSKGKEIFCVNSDVKFCKTKKELEVILEEQNKFFKGEMK